MGALLRIRGIIHNEDHQSDLYKSVDEGRSNPVDKSEANLSVGSYISMTTEESHPPPAAT